MSSSSSSASPVTTYNLVASYFGSKNEEQPGAKVDAARPVVAASPLADLQLPSAKLVVRDMMVHSGRLRKGKAAKGLPPVYMLNLTGTTQASAASSEYKAYYGQTQMIAVADWTVLSSLFDTVRVKSVLVQYQPCGKGASPSNSATFGWHVPMALAVDPNAAGTLSFTTLVGTRDWHDTKNNVLTNTSDPLKHVFAFPASRKVVSSSGSAILASLGDWTTTAAMANTAVLGGVYVATFILSPQNSTTYFGQFVYTFDCEWSYRI